MRGLDTNLLVRFLTEDDPDQTDRVRTFFASAEERNERLYLNTIVLCELAWTLRSQPYLFDRATISHLFEKVMETTLFEIEDRDLTRHALADYRQGRAGFSDYLIGRRNRAAGCDDTVTFDRKLRETAGLSHLA